MKELKSIRNEIDSIDDSLSNLFAKRMELVRDVARYKEANNIPILNTAREREILVRLTENLSDEMAGYMKVLFTAIFDVSRTYQWSELYNRSETVKQIRQYMESTPKLFPKSAVVAVQGTEGSNSQLACDRLFARPNIMYMNSFDAVFTSVEKGLCQYGILPIENSLHGSVTEVYDLMVKYKFHIVRGIKAKIDHRLLAKRGAKLSDIKEIFSHSQALEQCSEFLKGLKDVKVTACDNTALAAQEVYRSGRGDIAAIAGENCAELYNLSVLSDTIQNNDNNYTRFICIAKSVEIYPGSDKISLMFTVPHRPGALYSIIATFSSLGFNLSKLESRPIPGKDFEFMFYVDLEADIEDMSVLNLVAQLENSVEKFAFLGSYLEK